MRIQYDKYLENKQNKKDNINYELKNKCERLIEARKCKQINANHFAFKIIRTLEYSGYKSCSQKQMAILDSAIQEYEKEARKVQIIDYSVNETSQSKKEDNLQEESRVYNNDSNSDNMFMSDDYFDSMMGSIPDIDFNFDILGG